MLVVNHVLLMELLAWQSSITEIKNNFRCMTPCYILRSHHQSPSGDLLLLVFVWHVSSVSNLNHENEETNILPFSVCLGWEKWKLWNSNDSCSIRPCWWDQQKCQIFNYWHTVVGEIMILPHWSQFQSQGWRHVIT
jgi:hypothetical protein